MLTHIFFVPATNKANNKLRDHLARPWHCRKQQPPKVKGRELDRQPEPTPSPCSVSPLVGSVYPSVSVQEKTGSSTEGIKFGKVSEKVLGGLKCPGGNSEKTPRCTIPGSNKFC